MNLLKVCFSKFLSNLLPFFFSFSSLKNSTFYSIFFTLEKPRQNRFTYIITLGSVSAISYFQSYSQPQSGACFNVTLSSSPPSLSFFIPSFLPSLSSSPSFLSFSALMTSRRAQTSSQKAPEGAGRTKEHSLVSWLSGRCLGVRLSGIRSAGFRLCLRTTW